ncbi:hypothetical protein NsoK4_09110 [Nitrosopumilus sp. K4]|uniref:hypothetical protein n=1 Tax=Nitrosopumilus sp. K4 TaxID=2795383 RepID=UPI001BADD876|nr:hypothetical protein [Nitrosopumilus sp. K4]QUC64565.1 hypothetical protein NsoK4_09110 [Nitrosopumilus sp. K4]
MKMLKITPLLFMVLIALVPSVYGDTKAQTMEGSMDVKIEYPSEAVIGRSVTISVLVENKGWEDKQDISFVFSSQDNSMIPAASDSIIIEKLSQGGSFGANIDFEIPENANPGTNFLNVKYSQVLVANNENPQDPIFQDIAIPIVIKEKPNVTIYTKTPESIFANAEFPIEVELVSEDINISDVTIKVIPPKDIEFRGETMHTFSTIEKNTPVGITSRIITPTEEVNTEYKLPFEIIVEYTDDQGEENTESKTVSLVLRPRTFMELTTDGGIWIGDFFIAPYVSLGTIIGIPAGSIITLLIRKKTMPKKKKAKRKTKTKTSV